MLVIMTFFLFQTDFLHTYYFILMLGFDVKIFFSSFLSGVIGGIPSLFFETYTNFIYSPTVFLVNTLIIMRLISLKEFLINAKDFLLIGIFVSPLILISQALKIRYLAPFYFLYIIYGTNNGHWNLGSFIIANIITFCLSLVWVYYA